jgi:hypothetical protein
VKQKARYEENAIDAVRVLFTSARKIDAAPEMQNGRPERNGRSQAILERMLI